MKWPLYQISSTESLKFNGYQYMVKTTRGDRRYWRRDVYWIGSLLYVLCSVCLFFMSGLCPWITFLWPKSITLSFFISLYSMPRYSLLPQFDFKYIIVYIQSTTVTLIYAYADKKAMYVRWFLFPDPCTASTTINVWILCRLTLKA